MLSWDGWLTAVMVYEKTGRHGATLTPMVGATLLGLAAVVFAYPLWSTVPSAS